MHPANFSLKIEPMTVADIPASLEVDQAAYGPNFSPRNYRDELENNQLAHYFVLRQVGASSPEEQISSSSAVIGVGGFWLIAGELHLITISIHPRYRGLGLGEWLLLTLLEEGQKLAAEGLPWKSGFLILWRKLFIKNMAFKKSGAAPAITATMAKMPSFLQPHPSNRPIIRLYWLTVKLNCGNAWLK
jgi:GNAT superfamily N-acetyltransferase